MSSFDVVTRFRDRLLSEAEKPIRSNPSFAIAIGAGACLAGFVLLGPLASRGVADDAGAMAFLLGESRGRAPVQRFSPPPMQSSFYATDSSLPAITVNPARRVAAAKPKQRVARIVPLLDENGLPPVTKLVFAPKDMSPFDDHTLQRGDAVMTAKGLRIFQGARRYPFTVADFRSLLTARGVSHRNDLLAIDRATPAAQWSANFGAPPFVASIVRKPEISASAVRAIETFRRS